MECIKAPEFGRISAVRRKEIATKQIKRMESANQVLDALILIIGTAVCYKILDWIVS